MERVSRRHDAFAKRQLRVDRVIRVVGVRREKAQRTGE